MNIPYRSIGPELFTVDDPRIEPCPMSGCWLWIGATNGDGYGTTWTPQNRTDRAHRAVWERLCGPIPKGMHIDHICRVRSCVNPDHLRVVTPRVNALENSVSFAARNKAKGNCERCGNSFSERHSPCRGTNERYCKQCKGRLNREWWKSAKPSREGKCPECGKTLKNIYNHTRKQHGFSYRSVQ